MWELKIGGITTPGQKQGEMWGNQKGLQAWDAYFIIRSFKSYIMYHLYNL